MSSPGPKLPDAAKPAGRRPARSWFEGRARSEEEAPKLFHDTASFWRAVAQLATVLMAALMLGAFFYFARAFLMPVLCALVVSLTLGPLMGIVARRGVPDWLSATVTVLLLIGVVNVAVIALAKPVAELMARAPEIGAAIKEKLTILDRPMAAFHELQTALGFAQNATGVDANASRVIEGVVTVVTPAAFGFLAEAVIFIGTLFFLLVGRTSLRRAFVSWFGSRDARLRALKIFNDMEENLSGYLVVVTCINLGLGVVTTLLAFMLGLPVPIMWGVLAWALNYLPYVGPAIMTVLLFLIGLLTYPTLTGALLPPALFVAVTLVEGQILTPMIVGRSVIEVHPIAIFLGIAFWAWLWGPVGAFLAVPILVIAYVVLEHVYPAEKSDLPA